jgi:DNA-directed RNA polymerase specialized sigma24 family protein
MTCAIHWGEHPLNYLATVLLNKIRRIAGKLPARPGDDAPEPSDPDPGPAKQLEHDDRMTALLGRLTPRQRTIALAILDECAMPEIESRAGCSRWTVRRELNDMGDRLFCGGLEKPDD